MPQKEKEVFVRDPIHGLIRLDEIPVVKDLIDTPTFQRLRRIQQLGFTSMTYPSATHTRLAHSIGTMNVFCRIFNHLMDQEGVHGGQRTELLKLGCSTALLHDIGHGPLSHVSEKPLGFKHEDISRQLLENPDIAKVLDDHRIKKSRISRIISGTATKSDILIRQLVSSQLDCDRMDYLMRDAYFTGVGLGKIDLDRMVNLFQVYHRGNLSGYAVGLKKSRYTIESYIITRHMMYQEVYYHKATRGCEVLFGRIIARAKFLLKNQTLKVPAELDFIGDDNHEVTSGEILPLDDVFMMSTVVKWSKSGDKILSGLCRMLLERQLLKAIELSREKYIQYQEGGLKSKIEKLARDAGLDPEYHVGVDHSKETPYEPYPLSSPEDGGTPISNVFIYNQKGIPEDIAAHSDVLKGLPTHYNDRLYVPQQVKADCEATINE